MAKARRTKKASHEDPQLELLRGIWNEMKALNSRIDQTNSRIDGTNQRLEQNNARLDTVGSELKEEISQVRTGLDALGRRMVESDVRLATATTQLASDVQTLSGLVREWRDEHRADRAELRGRVARLEDHVGIGTQR